ncbi:low molecular weight protein-tyrosine-phosphatase [Prochlorococcus marinus]|uniref:Low molecular weight phosphotyrosine protein phosphatase n=1 Tax=Prochlorococcus marinus (strain MIT 9211) TaxID=93059 RepID=A9BCT1_PROM4|nr:low molecular weight protein-tyrosine-phosphatase [Prochlorococcus marinus]ABX09643.1 Low molecular weight phosphotyrosine protein phosphatase [Prochlorococcus marinus str. MIT 9211]
MAKKLLFVCLGNICRSPAAEAVFLYQTKDTSEHYLVDSAGTGGWHVGRLADARMRDAALRRGITINSRARQISLKDFEEFDLILTMDNANLADVKSLAKEINCPDKAKIIPLLSYAKNTELIEVPDPYYGGEKGFEEVLDLLEDAISGLLYELRE